MTKTKKTETAYRTAILPGLGQIEVPAHMTDEEVLAEVFGGDAGATPKKKDKKKP